MFNNRTALIAQIKQLSNELDIHYKSELNFRNHCYLRIAYDNTVNDKWDTIVKKPFTKYATEESLLKALAFLDDYKKNKNVLIADNDKSLNFRMISSKEKVSKNYLLF